MSIFSKRFVADTGERAINTAAQAAIGVLAVGPVTDLASIDWSAGVSLVAIPTVVSILKSIVAGTQGNPDSASLLR